MKMPAWLERAAPVHTQSFLSDAGGNPRLNRRQALVYWVGSQTPRGIGLDGRIHSGAEST